MNYNDMIQDNSYNRTLVMDYIAHDVTPDLYENITLALPFHPITSFIEQYTIPVLSLFGLISNTLSAVVFLQKPLRDSSCSILLTARSFADNGFLTTLLIIWISQTFNLKLGTYSVSCQIIIFLSYLCGCISAWLVVFVTLENYIRICKPFVVKRFCTTGIAKIAVVVLCLISVCFYSFPFWTISEKNCLPLSQYHNTVHVLIYIDTILTLALPLCCIIYLMTAIVCNLTKSYNVRNRRRAAGNPLAKVTKMLCAVTVTFFCLNLPSHIYRLISMMSVIISDKTAERGQSIQEEAVQQITLLMSYVSLSTNIVVYIIFGTNFRKVLLGMCHLCSVSKTTESNGQGSPGKTELGNNTTLTITSPDTKHKYLTVVLTNNELSSELLPLDRPCTNDNNI